MENSIKEYTECLKAVFDIHIAKLHIAAVSSDQSNKCKELLSFSKDFNRESIEKGNCIKSKFQSCSKDLKSDLRNALSEIYSGYYDKFEIELAA